MEFSISGVEEIGRFADFAPAWLDVRAPVLAAEAMIEDAVLRLEDDTTSPTGKRWRRWSTAYAATRTASDKLLYSSGDMARSFDVRMRSGVAEVTSSVPYAAVHQYGSSNGRTPAREYIGPGKLVEAALSDILDEQLRREFG